MERRRFAFLIVFLAAMMIVSVLEATGTSDTVLQDAFAEVPLITNVFAGIVVITVVGNIFLAVVSPGTTGPYGNTLSFARALGPLGGAVFDVSTAGYFAYTCFLTATTVFQLNFSGKLTTLLPSPTIGLIMSLMYFVLIFAAYSAYSLFNLIWTNPYLRESSPLKAVVVRQMGLD